VLATPMTTPTAAGAEASTRRTTSPCFRPDDPNAAGDASKAYSVPFGRRAEKGTAGSTANGGGAPAPPPLVVAAVLIGVRRAAPLAGGGTDGST
jgi:hypothetical protein